MRNLTWWVGLGAIGAIVQGCGGIAVWPAEQDDGAGGGATAVSSTDVASTTTAARAAVSTSTTGSTICTRGPCVLASGFDASDLAVDASYVYVASRTHGGVVRVPKLGGEPEVLAQGAGPARSIALLGDAVVWSDEAGVWSARLDGGSSTLIASVPGGAGPIAADWDGVFFAPAGDAGWIGRAWFDAPPEVVVANATFPRDLSLLPGIKDWSRLYFVDGIAVSRLYLDGVSAPEPILFGAGGPSALLAADEGTYVVTRELGSVSRTLPSVGGEFLAAGLDAPEAVAVDDELAYVTLHGNGTDANGGVIAFGRFEALGIVSVVEGRIGPTAIAADADAIYWLEDNAATTVMRLDTSSLPPLP